MKTILATVGVLYVGAVMYQLGKQKGYKEATDIYNTLYKLM